MIEEEWKKGRQRGIYRERVRQTKKKYKKDREEENGRWRRDGRWKWVNGEDTKEEK